ncbi:MAG: TonB-dependent receptor, partial [Sphingomonadales bacterium]
TPDLEGHAIGGVINMVTPSAYDYDDLAIRLQGEAGIYVQRKGFHGSSPSGTADFLVANKFGQNDEFGVVLTGNYFRRFSYLPWAQFERFRFYDADGAETGAYADDAVHTAPGQRRYHWYKNDRTRYGGMVKFEHRPSTDVHSFLKVYYNTAEDDEARQTDVWANQAGNTLVDAGPDSGTLVGDNFRSQQQLGLFDFERSVWGAQIGTDYSLNDTTRMKLRGSYSAALFKNPESFIVWRRDSSDYAFSFVRDGNAFNVTPNDVDAAFDLDNLPMVEWNLTERRMKEKVYEVSADFEGDSLFSSDSLGYMTGVQFRRTDRSFDENRFVQAAVAGNDLSLGASGLATLMPAPKMPGILSGQNLITIDSRNTLGAVQQHIADNPAQWVFNDQPDVDVRSDYGVQEDVYAAYAAVTHHGDRHRMVAGLRVEATRYDTTGNRALDGVYQPVEDSGSYTNFLPSVNYSYDVSDSLVVRAAYGRTIGRAPFNQFAPSQESVSTAGTQPTVSRSNPDLKPRISDNIDLSFEKYLDGGSGIVAVGAFYKRIEDEIFVRATEQQVDIFGETMLALVSQPENAGETVNLYGLEFNLVKNFDFLPAPFDGFGGSLNATKIWNDFSYQANTGDIFEPRTMLGQANKIVNASLFYDKGRFSAKLAFNYMGLQMDRLDSNPDNISYVDEEWGLDFKASYNVLESLAVTFNAFNFAGKTENLLTGRFQEQPGRRSNFGSAYFIGLSYVY